MGPPPPRQERERERERVVSLSMAFSDCEGFFSHKVGPLSRWDPLPLLRFLLLIVLTNTGKRKHTPPCSSEELLFAAKKWGPQRKDFGGRHGFPSFYGVFVSTTGLEGSSFRPEKFSKDSLSVVVVCAFFFSANKVPMKEHWNASSNP